MSVKKSLADTVRVIIVIDMLVVVAVLACPEQRRVFEGRSAKDQRKQPDDPVCLKSKVREESMIAKRDRKSGREEHHKKQRDLERVDPEEPQINRHGGK